MPVLTLTRDQYPHLEGIRVRFGLDFDDAYQYLVAKRTGRTLVTMDTHFRRCNDLQVQFLS